MERDFTTFFLQTTFFQKTHRNPVDSLGLRGSWLGPFSLVNFNSFLYFQDFSVLWLDFEDLLWAVERDIVKKKVFFSWGMSRTSPINQSILFRCLLLPASLKDISFEFPFWQTWLAKFGCPWMSTMGESKLPQALVRVGLHQYGYPTKE